MNRKEIKKLAQNDNTILDSYIGADLYSTPPRLGILSLDAFQDDVPKIFLDAELLFLI